MAATEDRPLYNFYFRYEWNETDFANWQNTMIGMLRDTLGTIMGPAIISGGAISNGSGLSVNVAAFIALGDDGYLHVKNSTTSNVALAAAHATLNRKDLVVARKTQANGTMINRPTSPFDSVALTTLQGTSVVVITGTPNASPVFPSKTAGDVVLGGVLVNATATAPSGYDTTVAEVISGNTNFANWVVGKDVNNTASLTGGASATRSTLIGIGNNGHSGVEGTGNGAASGVKGTGGATNGAGVEGIGGATNGVGVKGTGTGTGAGGYFDGQGDGTGATDDAIEIIQNLKLAGSNPVSTTGFTNRLTPALVPKAWGILALTSGAVAVSGGAAANVASVGFNGNNIRVTLAAAMTGSSEFAAFAIQMGNANNWVMATNRGIATTQFDIMAKVTTSGADVNLSTGQAGTIAFVVFGRQ